MSSLAKEYFQKASMYDLLAGIYKYSNPHLHIKYYQKHLHFTLLAQQEMQAKKNQRRPLYHHIRFLNLYHNEVSIELNGWTVIPTLPSFGVSDYFPVPHQVHHFRAVSSHDPDREQTCNLLNGPNTSYCTYAIIETNNALRFFPIPTDNNLPENETKLRVISLAKDTSPMEVRVKHGDTVFSSIMSSQITDYLGLTPMTLQLYVTQAKSNQILLQLSPMKLKANEVYSLYIMEDHMRVGELQTLLIKD